MKLIDALPKDGEGNIVLDPSGTVDGNEVVGKVSPEMFATLWPDLAEAECPLATEQFEALRGIDSFWRKNADRWRSEGLI